MKLDPMLKIFFRFIYTAYIVNSIIYENTEKCHCSTVGQLDYSMEREVNVEYGLGLYS